jgi:hypothetical protein
VEGGNLVSKKLSMCLSLLAATLVGLVVGLYAQSNSASRLARLSEEKAEISKMDLVLLNTRVGVLQEMLKDDLTLPFIPTSFKYDVDNRKIRIAVYVAPTLLVKTNANQLVKTLENRAAQFCTSPELAEGNFVYMFPVQPPTEYCAIRFFTDALDREGHVEPKDVAVFEDGKLTMR